MITTYRDIPSTTVVLSRKSGDKNVIYKDTRLDYDFVESMIYSLFAEETAVEERFASPDEINDIFQSWVRRNRDYVEQVLDDCVNERCLYA